MRARTLLACLLAALGVSGCAPSAEGVAGATRGDADRGALERIVELARGKAPYLVVDLEDGRLRLMQGGAVLRDCPLRAAELGLPSVLFFRSSPGSGSWNRVYESVRLDPPRVDRRPEIIAPEPGSAPGTEDTPAAEPVYIPPLPEEAIPAPPRYFLRIDGGWTVEIAGPREVGRGPLEWLGSALGAKWQDLRDVVARRGPRLRIVLDAPDAASLYRSLPEDVKLTIL